MGELFRFLVRYRLLFLFIALEIVSIWIIVTQNDLQRSAWLSSSNKVMAGIMQTTHAMTSYFYLARENENLALENARLNQLVQQKADLLAKYTLDTMHYGDDNTRFKFIVARVINNSVSNVNNYLTLNKGLKDGIRPGMGIISPQGIVGKVIVSSNNFSTGVSLLHTKMLISGKINRINAYGTVIWEGNNPKTISMKYVARHLEPIIGDTVITSEYSTLVPEGIMIGIVKNIELKPDETFYRIDVELSTDFSALSYVYVIENRLSHEKDSLETVTKQEIK